MLTLNLLGGLIFSGVGFVAFVYGRKQGLWKTAVIGILLMAYPYFFSDTLVVIGIGVALTIALFVFKD